MKVSPAASYRPAPGEVLPTTRKRDKGGRKQQDGWVYTWEARLALPVGPAMGFSLLAQLLAGWQAHLACSSNSILASGGSNSRSSSKHYITRSSPHLRDTLQLPLFRVSSIGMHPSPAEHRSCP